MADATGCPTQELFTSSLLHSHLSLPLKTWACMLSLVWLFVTPWMVARQDLLSTEFSKQEYWSGLPFPSPGNPLNSGIKPRSPALTGGLFTTVPPAAAAAVAAKLLQSCLTLCDPIDGSPSGSHIPGILQQEHWNGLPFPSPMHESEKWKWSCSVVSDSSQPHGLQPTRLLHPWDFPGKSTGVGCHCLLQLYHLGSP